MLRECKKMRENEPSHFQGNSHLGSWSLERLPNLLGVIAGFKTHWFEIYHWKAIET
jgi:hypothetical protein